MSASNSKLADLTIWDSIRDCATSSLRRLVGTIEAEVSKDQTLVDLRKTGTIRMAIEFRARGWMARAYECCLKCWKEGQLKEETPEVRTAIVYYGLWPFFHGPTFTQLLRLAAGVSQDTIDRLERGDKYYGGTEQGAIHDASEVYSALMNDWTVGLPPIKKREVKEESPISKAPRPPTVLSGTGGWSPILAHTIVGVPGKEIVCSSYDRRLYNVRIGPKRHFGKCTFLEELGTAMSA